MKGLATTREIAEYLNVKTQTLDAWASQGRGPAYSKIEGTRRYEWSDVRTWVDNRKKNRPVERPTLICQVCRTTVSQDGYLGVSCAAVAEARNGQRKHDAYFAQKTAERGEIAGRMIEGDEWDLIPQPARWYILHRTCDPRPDSGDYQYGIERVDTFPKFLDFLAHVNEKGWVRNHTDLTRLIRRVTGEAA